MPEENKYDLNDLVFAALEQRPSDFEAAFNDLVVDRLRDAVEAKKVEVAQNMYGQEEPEEYQEYEEDEFGAEEDIAGEEDGEVA